MPHVPTDDRRLSRRTWVKSTLYPAAAAILGGQRGTSSSLLLASEPVTADSPALPEIIDTNVHLSRWAFRPLKYADTERLVEKLKRHRIAQAWAGNFDAVFTRQFDEVNRRTAEDCKRAGRGILVPVGTVNPAGPDWVEDLRRCDKDHEIRVIRLYPSYHGYSLSAEAFQDLLREATGRGMLVQIVIRMEDDRIHHPTLRIPPVDVSPLPDIVSQIPNVRVQLLNCGPVMRGRAFRELVKQPEVTYDIAAVEGQGQLRTLLDGQTDDEMQLPVERLMFGSHAPYFPVESALLKLFESRLTLQESVAIMNRNASATLSSVS